MSYCRCPPGEGHNDANRDEGPPGATQEWCVLYPGGPRRWMLDLSDPKTKAAFDQWVKPEKHAPIVHTDPYSRGT